MRPQPKRFGPIDVVIGDYAWGGDVWLPRPVLQVNRAFITLGIHRDRGAWLTTQTLRWHEVRGVIPAEVDHDPEVASMVHAAADRVRAGFLSEHRRDALADLLLIATVTTLPTPLIAALRNAITALTGPDRTPPTT